MPKIGAEPQRRKALIHSAIKMIGERGSLDVSVKQIAKDAGMSSALAFHYFGDKDGIIIETMRHLLREFSASSTRRLKKATTPKERLNAIIETSFSSEQFDKATVATWLVFYVRAFSSPAAARFLNIYTSRLHSNLVFALKQVCEEQKAEEIAQNLGAMIDGIYIRHSLRKSGPDTKQAIQQCQTYLTALFPAANHEAR